jgi:23S rRNA (guanosine2251-2'-O)-methyltransferase
MAGNSQRRGAMRKTGTKKGAVKGSGGQKSKGLQGKGPTPRAEHRVNHPAAHRADPGTGRTGAARAVAGQRGTGGPSSGTARRGRPDDSNPETVLGRNPVVECLRAGVPATALYIAFGADADERLTESVRLAADRGIALLEVPRTDLDRLAGGTLHQGIALSVPPFGYQHPDDVIAAATSKATAGLLVALDGVTDPRNLGAVVRSAAAFGAQGVLLPQRRSAGMTAAAWRTSAGTAARMPIARATNLTRTLHACAEAGMLVVGLAGDGAVSLDEFRDATAPLVLVIGGEGRGLGRLVRDTCDLVVSIPMADKVESLNASVAAGVALADIARRRRAR